MAQDDGQERTEQPTQKRLQESREKGQVPRSRELTTLTMMLASGAGLLMLGEGMLNDIVHLAQSSFHVDRQEIFDVSLLYLRFQQGVVAGLELLVPFFVILVLIAFLAPLALGGWSFSVKAIAFKADKLDPIKGLGRVFGWKGLVEMFKALAKFILIATVAGFLLWMYMDELLVLGYESVQQGMAHLTDLLLWSFVFLSASMIAIAAIDVPFQIWDYTRQLRMTRQEIKDEYKQTDGNPEVKGKIRNLQHEMAQRRMMQEVPKADVVITNPTHYAVALRYDQESMGAPRLVASGVDLIALKIRAVADEHHVAVVEAPPLARALYYNTELDQEIPAGLYLAVAKVLAYVYQVEIYAREGGVAPTPVAEQDLPIPDDLRRDE